MVDSGIKKVTIPNVDLPITNTDIGGYAVRYRIVSEDRNRVSHWSPIHYVNAEYIYVKGKPMQNPTQVGDAVSVVWENVQVKKSTSAGDVSIGKIRDYEVWLRWDRGDAGDWAYEGKIQNNSVTFFKPDNYYKTIDGNRELQTLAPNRLSVEIYLESIPVARGNAELLMYSIENHTV